MKRLLSVILLAGLAPAFAVAAQSPPSQVPVSDHSSPDRQETVVGNRSFDTDGHQQFDDIRDRNCLRETGSRLPLRRDRNGGCVNALGRSYSREDIQSTGHIELNDALRTLDSSVY